MALTAESVTLTAAQVMALNHKLSELRHDVNNQLSLVVGAAELIRCKPETTPRMLGTLSAAPQRIAEQIRLFSDQFEKTFGLTRD